MATVLAHDILELPNLKAPLFFSAALMQRARSTRYLFLHYLTVMISFQKGAGESCITGMLISMCV